MIDDIKPAFELKQRLLFVLKSLAGLVQRVTWRDTEKKKVATGWYDWERDIHYVTWMKKNSD